MLRIERGNIYRKHGTIRSENFRCLLIGFRKNELSSFLFDVEDSARSSLGIITFALVSEISTIDQVAARSSIYLIDQLLIFTPIVSCAICLLMTFQYNNCPKTLISYYY